MAVSFVPVDRRGDYNTDDWETVCQLAYGNESGKSSLLSTQKASSQDIITTTGCGQQWPNSELEETEQLLGEQAARNDFTIRGIVSVYALVDSSDLKAVICDDLIYLADTSGDAAFYCAQVQTDTISRNNLTQCRVSELFPQPLFWDMEELGIANRNS